MVVVAGAEASSSSSDDDSEEESWHFLFLGLGSGLKEVRAGYDPKVWRLTMYFNLSRSLGIPWLTLSKRIMWAWMDSAPCSPISPAPKCHLSSQGMVWFQDMDFGEHGS